MNDVEMESRLRSVLSTNAAALPPSTLTCQEVLDESHRDAPRDVVVPGPTRRWQAGLAMGVAAAAVVAVIGVSAAVRPGRGEHSSNNAAGRSTVTSDAWPTPCPQQLPDSANPAENFGPFKGLVSGNSDGIEYRMSYRAGTDTVLLGVCTWERKDPAATVWADQVGNWMRHEVLFTDGWAPMIYQLVPTKVNGFVGFVPEAARTARMIHDDGSPATELVVSEETFNGYRIVYGQFPPANARVRMDFRDANGQPLTQRNMYVAFHDQVGPTH